MIHHCSHTISNISKEIVDLYHIIYSPKVTPCKKTAFELSQKPNPFTSKNPFLKNFNLDSNPKTDLSLKLKETQSAMKQAGRPQEGQFDAKVEYLLTMDHHASRNHLNDDNLGKQISQKLSDITKDGVFKDATKTVLHMRKAPIAQKHRAVESMNLPVLGDVPKLNVLDKKKSIKYQLGSSLSNKLSSKNDLKSRSRSIMHSYEAIPRSIATVYALKNRRIKVLSGIKQLKTKSK